MAEEQYVQIHLETVIERLETGRALFDDLVTSNKDNLVERLYSLNEEGLRAIVLERVVAARGSETFVPGEHP